MVMDKDQIMAFLSTMKPAKADAPKIMDMEVSEND